MTPYQQKGSTKVTLCCHQHTQRECKHTELLSYRLKRSSGLRQRKTGRGWRRMSVKLHYKAILSDVRDRMSKWGGGREETFVNLRSHRSRRLMCSLNQACKGLCAQWLEDEWGHTWLCACSFFGEEYKRPGWGLRWQKTCRSTIPLEFNLSLKSMNPTISCYKNRLNSAHVCNTNAGCTSGA